MTTIYTGKWCVYAHYVGGKCIYVGMGRPNRAFGNVPARSREWSELVKNGYDVQLLSWHETQQECLAREIAVIRDVKPLCNKMHNGWVPDAFKENWRSGPRGPMSEAAKAKIAEAQRHVWQRGRRHAGRPPIPIVCVETGQVFGSMSDAARDLGVSVSAIHASINRKRPVVGMTFVKEVQV